MNDTDQSEVFAFLANPASYRFNPAKVTRVSTHIAEVFLAGERVFKVKRAVRYAFVDFSTLTARREACRSEVELNARTAPEIYLGVAAVRRGPDGQLALDEVGKPVSGEPIEWLVVMRRFDEKLTFDKLADQGSLRPEWIDALIDNVIALHSEAGVRGAPHGGSDGLQRIIDENAADMADYPDVFQPKRSAALLDAERGLLAANADLLNRRRDAGFVRRCHGDLHLGNVVLWRDHPTLFDCIEFSDQIATIDIAYDLAFLLMDLEVRGLRPLANRALARYFGRQGGIEVLSALPLMLALRAGVRAKVTAMALAGVGDRSEAAQMTETIERFMAAAERFIAPASPPYLIAVGGLSGSGKTTLAAALAPLLGRAPGALLLRSDVLRKRLGGKRPEQRLHATAYTPEANDAVYRSLMAEAAAALSAGQCAVVDAVFAREAERQAIEEVARAAGMKFRGFWLAAPAATMMERVADRPADASDATPEVVHRQTGYDTGPITWARIDAGQGPQAVLEQAKTLLRLS